MTSHPRENTAAAPSPADRAPRFWRFAVMLFVAMAILPTGAAAQRADPGVDFVPDLVVVAPTSGPAWWKVSKGSTVVWILGLPEARMPAGMSWDRTTLKRRLRGARMLLAPATEYSQFKPGEAAPLLPRDLAEKVLAAYQANGLRFYSNRPPSVATGMDLQYLYYQRHRLTYDLRKVIYADAKRAGVPIVSPSERKHALLAGDMTSANPEVAECMSAIVDYVHIPPERLRQVAARWAVGDVRAMLETAPRSLNYSCRRFWTGHLERTVDFQTDRIIEAMEIPGKVVAVAATSQLVAQDGILARLRAKGYTIADPTKPLEE